MILMLILFFFPHDRASALSPELQTLPLMAYQLFLSISFLQGQCLFDKGMFVEALESFSKAAEIKPNFRSYQFRRSVWNLAQHKSNV